MENKPECAPRSPIQRAARLVFLLLRLIVGGFLALLVLAVLGPSLTWLIQIPLLIAFGWIPFLRRTLGEVVVSPAGAVSAAVSLGVLAVAAHVFLHWLWSQRGCDRAWRAGWTAALLAGFVVSFATGICLVGLSHQLLWLAGSPAPIVENSFRVHHERRRWDDVALRARPIVARAIAAEVSLHAASGRLLEDFRAQNLDFQQAAAVYLGAADAPPSELLLFPRDPEQRTRVGLRLVTAGAIERRPAADLPALLDRVQP